jgi:hypothetical protein
MFCIKLEYKKYKLLCYHLITSGLICAPYAHNVGSKRFSGHTLHYIHKEAVSGESKKNPSICNKKRERERIGIGPWQKSFFFLFMSKRKNSQVWISAEKQRKSMHLRSRSKKERDGSKMLSTTSNGYF